jgi:hypothetical protein
MLKSMVTVQKLADECGISVGSCHTILTEELNMLGVAGKFVTRLLTDEQKGPRVAISPELLHRANDEEDFSKNIVTDDETWVYGYDETK